MNLLFKKRLSNHLIEITKYLKYVLNDFFVIAMMFFIGGLGYEYSELLKILHPGMLWTGWVIGIVIFLSIQLGRYATFLKKPDYIFLLPKEHDMHYYLKRCLNYSFLCASFIQLIVWFILLPFIKVTNHASTIDLIAYLLLMIIIKYCWLQSDLLNGYRIQILKFKNDTLIKYLFPLMLVIIAILVSPILSVIISIILMILLIMKLNQWQTSSLNWLALINNEYKRMHDIYQFFNLFTDVPQIISKPKRRRYLDFILHKIKLTYNNSYLYLYLCGIFRDNEFSSLYLRLTIIGMVLIYFVKGMLLSSVLSLLFIYIIGFQLIPFYFHFDSNIFVHIYPFPNGIKLKSFEKIITVLLLISTILFNIVLFISTLSLINLIVVFILDLIEIIIFKYLYIAKKIRNKINLT